jgi:hypothetical protein
VSHPAFRVAQYSIFRRWLIAHDRHDEAALVISSLADKPITDPVVVTEMKEIRFSVQYEREHSIRWRDLLKPQAGATKTLRRLLLGAGTQLMQQFQGMRVPSSSHPTTDIFIRHQHHVLLPPHCAH